MTGEKYVVDGFVFKSAKKAAEAKNEYEGVMYMKSRTNTDNPANVYAVYNSLVEKKLFKTPVGLKYLCELRQILISSGLYEEKDIMLITVESQETAVKEEKVKEKKVELTKRDVIRNMKKYDIELVYRNRFINALLLNILLIVAIVLIILIANNGDNTNIFNYKSRIDAEYSEKEDILVQWENELDIREEIIINRENELENEPATP